MLSSPRKPPSKMFKPCGSFRFTCRFPASGSSWESLARAAADAPGEIQQELVEDPLQELVIAAAAGAIAVVLKYAHCRPGVHRRIDVAGRPFTCQQLAGGADSASL